MQKLQIRLSYRNFQQKCVDRETKCHDMIEPSPDMLPIQLKWTKDTDGFNPFQSVRVLLLASTFDGSQSGISKFSIHCVARKLVNDESTSATVSYDKNSTLTLKNLDANSEYTIVVSAYGCKNQSVSTKPITVKTDEFESATIDLEKEKYQNKLDEYRENQATKNKGSTFAIFKITESWKNILHGNIESYQIGETTFQDPRLTIFSTTPPTEVVHCDDELDHMTCYLIAAYNDPQNVLFKAIHTSGRIRNVNSFRIPIDQSSNLAVPICMALIAIVILALVAVFAFLFMKKQKRKNELEMNPKAHASYQDSQLVPLYNSKEKPMSLEQLIMEVEREGFNPTGEYSKIDDLDNRFIIMCQSKEVAKSWSDRTQSCGNMNRYGNILPYDATRVVLKEPINDCDYINASWIRGYKNITYIATQGPLKHTCPHFWRMVVENNVQLIVMLTKLKERNTIRGMQFGSLFFDPQG